MTHSDQSLTASKTRKSRYRGFATNSSYQSARAVLIRQWIFEILGRKCELCGETDGPMEVNHLYRREYSVSRLSTYKRQLRYWKDVQRGLCNCLCKSCNANWRPAPAEQAPPPSHVDPRFLAWMERHPPTRRTLTSSPATEPF